MKHLKITTLSLPVFAFGFVQTSHATVLDFESLAEHGEYSIDLPSGYMEDGYVFDNLENPYGTNGFAAWQMESPLYAGSTALHGNQPDCTTRLSRIGGGTFEVSSIDLACVYLNHATQTVTFTGTKADHSTISESFYLSNPDVLTTFTFRDMTDITKLEWKQTWPYHQFDNIVTTELVPEPASIASVAVGIVALLRRRKKR